MTYSVDLRERVVSFVARGGGKAEASRRFEVSIGSIHNWCALKDLTPKAHPRRFRKLDWDALAQHVKEHDDALLRERAAHFGVCINSIWYAMNEMGISHKKNNAV